MLNELFDLGKDSVSIYVGLSFAIVYLPLTLIAAVPVGAHTNTLGQSLSTGSPLCCNIALTISLMILIIVDFPDPVAELENVTDMTDISV